MNWASWSKDAVALMQSRNEDWRRSFGLVDATYHWDLDSATMRFESPSRTVLASLCVVGTTSASEGTFLWGWANRSLPAAVTGGLDVVRRFGEEHDLPLLVSPEIPGARAEGLECTAIAGRIQDAAGVFVDTCGDVTMFFTLAGFREVAA